MWERCSKCDRTSVCPSNLNKIRSVSLLGGVTAGSFAAGWQSSIGVVTAGSLFAALQSLGVTDTFKLLFGSVCSALGLLGTVAVRFGWCNDDCDYNSDEFMWEKCTKCKKPVVSEENLLKLRTVASAGFLKGKDNSPGEQMLSIIVSDANDFDQEHPDIDRKWQSRVGTFASSRLFTALKTLGDDGLVVIFFGDIPSALKLLATVMQMDWCKNGCNYNYSNNEVLSANNIISASEIRLENRILPVNETNPKHEETSSSENENKNKLKEIFRWERCPNCDRPLVCDSNVMKIRLMVGGGVIAGGSLGAFALPLLGFGSGGVAAGSFAAGWQSSIGAVAAGSLFAILQSLGATGLGTLLFGGIGSAVGLLLPLAARLNWCSDDCEIRNLLFANKNY